MINANDTAMFFSAVILIGSIMSLAVIVLGWALHTMQIAMQEGDPAPAPTLRPRSTRRHAWGMENGTDPYALHMVTGVRLGATAGNHPRKH